MKLLAALLLIGATSAPAFAGGPRPYYRGQRNVHYEEKCYKNVERYIPGHYDDFGNWKNGRVKNTRKRVPCHRLYERPRRPYYMPQTTPNSFPRYEEEHPNVGDADNNSCLEGSILGGIAGAGAGAALSRGDGRWWAIPLGIVGGSMVGCQVDGG
tara:strand:- start:33 stop:497 length:465 start_codon:yes stop_codon:yes gene_type:complete